MSLAQFCFRVLNSLKKHPLNPPILSLPFQLWRPDTPFGLSPKMDSLPLQDSPAQSKDSPFPSLDSPQSDLLSDLQNLPGMVSNSGGT